jgi:hypothetical protein
LVDYWWENIRSWIWCLITLLFLILRNITHYFLISLSFVRLYVWLIRHFIKIILWLYEYITKHIYIYNFVIYMNIYITKHIYIYHASMYIN